MADRRLQVFHAVAKHGSFTRAAEHLHMTQPAVTFQIKQLEEHFDTRLLDRGHGKISLTPAGELVLALSLLDGPALPGLERQVGLLLALVGLALISGLAAALYAKAYGITFLGEPRTGFAANARPLGWKTLWPLALPAAVCVTGGLAAPMFFDLASMTGLAALPMPNDMQAAAAAGQDQARTSLAMVSLVCSIALGLSLAGIILRKRMLRRRSVTSMPTWGCGYQGGSPRIQYTDAGFSEPLGKIFAPGMWLNVRMNLDSRLFP